MGRYLDGMDKAASAYRAIRPAEIPPRVLAALGPRMLALAAERAQGAHPYLVTPEHTAKARAALGHSPWLLPEQAVVLETSPDQARAIARRHISRYLDLPNYTNNWRRLGFNDDDLMGQGSDRLIDALVAWGDVEAVTRRVKEHLYAGADHVCIQVLDADAHGLPMRQWRKLAPTAVDLTA
jgi:probable F420-dependent oxidoreductase